MKERHHFRIHPAHFSSWIFVIVIATTLLSSTESFCAVPYTVRNSLALKTPLSASLDPSDDISRWQERARALLEKSKAKLEGRGVTNDANHDGPDNLPFFASQTLAESSRREQVIKSKNETTGLITADGEKMAARSEKEQWEFRPLVEVFDSETEETQNLYSVASQQLTSRDVAASIWNLRKTLQTDDYRRIFDKNNRFIGEDI
jgi:hypothetical protein